jgi:hypothetical protein
MKSIFRKKHPGAAENSDCFPIGGKKEKPEPMELDVSDENNK